MQLAITALTTVMAAAAPQFMTERPNWPSVFDDYCAAIRAEQNASPDGPPIDPARLPSGARFFTLPVMDEIFGEKVAAASRSLGDGVVEFGFIVNVNRRIEAARVLQSSNPSINNQVKHLLETAKFTPAWLDGQFVSSCMYMKVTLRLE